MPDTELDRHNAVFHQCCEMSTATFDCQGMLNPRLYLALVGEQAVQSMQCCGIVLLKSAGCSFLAGK